MKKRVLYAVANYEELVRDNGYFVDKTRYIERLESINNPVFLRPRRFGKSLWCRILECYRSVALFEKAYTMGIFSVTILKMLITRDVSGCGLCYVPLEEGE